MQANKELKRSSILVSETAAASLRHLHPEAKKAIRSALDDLSKTPFIGKPLKREFAGLWSLPVSHHRVIYQTEPGGITIVFVGRRSDVYERLRELLQDK